jgi:hypothetical protein
MNSLNKTLIWMAILIFVVFTGCVRQSSFEIQIDNQSELGRIDEPVIINRLEIEKLFPEGIPVGKVPMVLNEKGDTIPTQVDDLNGDGNWDELFMLVSIPAETNSIWQLVLVETNLLPKFTNRSNVWLASPQADGIYQEVKKAQRPNITRENHGQTKNYFQFEGPGWENDRVGFRNYFDERNGMDIFGKKTEKMVLQKVGINEDYHALQDWGMDILKVGTSLGAGSIAIDLNDKLHRVAPGSEGTYELIANGPLRSIFRLKFDNWMVENNSSSVVHEITIYGGAWYFESKVKIQDTEENARIVTGITTIDLQKKEAAFIDHGNGVVSISTHGQQAIEGEFLGMAIMLNKSDYISFEYLDEKAEDINHTFIVRMNPRQEPTSYRFYSAWELSDEKFADPEKFEELLKNDALRMGSPLKVIIK